MAAPVFAEEDAVSVTFCATPASSVRVDGLAVTPLGRPLSETLTVPVNPFNGLAVMATLFPAAPSVIDRLVGETVSEKSAAAVADTTVNASVAAWVSPPDVPLSVTVVSPVCATVDAASVTLCATPGVSVSVDGLAATPLGRPLSEAVTVPVNPFRALAVTEMLFPATPSVSDKLAGDSVSEKSGAGVEAATVRVSDVVALALLPEVPVKVTRDGPVVAPDAAVIVTVCGVPGVRLKEEGVIVTPVGGALLSPTLTIPLKPLSAFAVRETVCDGPPAVTVRSIGERVSENPGVPADATARDTVAVRLRPPEAPVTVMVVLAAGAFSFAVSVTVCVSFGVSVRLAGLAVTPLGRSLTVMFTIPVKPFVAVAVTDNFCAAPPAVMFTVL